MEDSILTHGHCAVFWFLLFYFAFFLEGRKHVLLTRIFYGIWIVRSKAQNKSICAKESDWLFLTVIKVYFSYNTDLRTLRYTWVRFWNILWYLSVLEIHAISGTRGPPGLQSHSSEQMHKRTLKIDKPGDHCELRVLRQILPLQLIFRW